MSGDLLIFATTTEGTSLPDAQNGLLCRGETKLLQRAVLELLTRRGSMTYQPTRGTLLLPQLQRRRFRNEQQILALFAAACNAVKRNLAADVQSGDPDEEIPVDFYVERLSLIDGVLLATLTLQTQASTSSRTTLALDLL